MAEEGTARYRLGARIGGGGMAEVFEATLVGAEGFARPVAVKRMLPQLSSEDAFGQMFVNEARIASLLHHANIVDVLDFDRDNQGRYFLVMELIRGVDLRQLVDTGRLPVAASVHIASEMLRGLSYAHELEHEGRPLGIVHRDISPHNVMVSWDGAVKLVDFGIAKAVAATGVSRVGTIKGKLAYMSPEQAGALELDGRSDVFAVGVVLHELLSGERLFRGATEPEVLARVLSQPIPRPSEITPDVPAELDRLVLSMLERDRDARCSSAHDALDQLLTTSASSARGGLDLERILVARFPDRAPRRASTSGASSSDSSPASTAQITPAPPAHRAAHAGAAAAAPLARTVPERPGARGKTLRAMPVSEAPTQVAPSAAEAPTMAAADSPPLGAAGGQTVTARGTPAPVAPAVPRRMAEMSAWPTRAQPMANQTPVAMAPPRAIDRPIPPRRPWRAGAAVVLAAAGLTVGGLLVASAVQGDADREEPRAASAVSESDIVAAPPPRSRASAAEPPTAGAGVTNDGLSDSDPGRVRAAADTGDSRERPGTAPAPPKRADGEPSGRDRAREASQPGVLDVTVEPWAEVIVNGTSYGQTPKTIPLKAGTHRLLLRNPELPRSENQRVRIQSGKTLQVKRDWN